MAEPHTERVKVVLVVIIVVGKSTSERLPFRLPTLVSSFLMGYERRSDPSLNSKIFMDLIL